EGKVKVGELTAHLHGTGTGDDDQAKEEPNLKLSKDDLRFARVKKGKSAELTLEVTNKGSSTAKVGAIEVSGDYFWKRKDDCPEKLKPGKTCVIKRKFKPAKKGKFEGRVRVGTLKADLHGTGK